MLNLWMKWNSHYEGMLTLSCTSRAGKYESNQSLLGPKNQPIPCYPSLFLATSEKRGDRTGKPPEPSSNGRKVTLKGYKSADLCRQSVFDPFYEGRPPVPGRAARWTPIGPGHCVFHPLAATTPARQAEEISPWAKSDSSSNFLRRQLPTCEGWDCAAGRATQLNLEEWFEELPMAIRGLDTMVLRKPEYGVPMGGSEADLKHFIALVVWVAYYREGTAVC